MALSPTRYEDESFDRSKHRFQSDETPRRRSLRVLLILNSLSDRRVRPHSDDAPSRSQGLAQLPRERLRRKGFLQEETPLFEMPVPEDRLVRVTRHVEHLDARPQSLDSGSQVRTAHG